MVLPSGVALPSLVPFLCSQESFLCSRTALCLAFVFFSLFFFSLFPPSLQLALPKLLGFRSGHPASKKHAHSQCCHQCLWIAKKCST